MFHNQSVAVGGKMNVTLPPVDLEGHLEVAEGLQRRHCFGFTNPVSVSREVLSEVTFSRLNQPPAVVADASDQL